MHQLKNLFTFIFNHFEEIIVIICMFGIVILTFIAVIARYVFRMPIAGADEIATYMFLWASLFGASAAFKYNKHGGVPLLADMLPANLRRISDLLVLALTAVFLLIIVGAFWDNP